MSGFTGWIRAAVVVGGALAVTACSTYPSEPRYSTRPTGAGGYPQQPGQPQGQQPGRGQGPGQGHPGPQVGPPGHGPGRGPGAQPGSGQRGEQVARQIELALEHRGIDLGHCDQLANGGGKIGLLVA